MEPKRDSTVSDDRYTNGSYWETNTSFHEEDAEFKVSQAVGLLKRNQLSPESILDVGCGSGRHAYLLAVHFGVPTVGIDISPAALNHARSAYSRSNLDFRLSPVSTYPEKVHLGVMFDVFEHVEDYLGFLREARPKADYWLFNIPLDMTALSAATGSYMKAREQMGHLHYFSEASALAALKDCGYTVRDHHLANHVLHGLRTAPSFKRVLAALPRLGLSIFGASFAVRLLAGAPLIVLCKSD